MPKVMLYRAIAVSLFLCLPTCAHSLSSPSGDEDALVDATKAMCHVQVAMLGESSTHGDGHTFAFKIALVERLVDQCGFDSVFFEANQAEFIHLNKRLRLRQTVTSDDLLTAVGGLWKFYAEFQPVAPFLLTRAQTGQIFLGGLDDQLGLFGQDYANIEMVAELANLLPQPERLSCSTALHKRIYNDYTDAAPYSPPDRAQISTCLSDIQAASVANEDTNAMDKEDRQEMISAAQRWISRDFSSEAESIVGRDRSMFQNFEWLQSRLPRRHKVIIWAATVHIAKQGDPAWGDHTGTNFGSFVHQRYGKDAFSLGFSALNGSYRQARRNTPEIPLAPSDSVETRGLQNSGAGATYIGSAKLVGMNTVPGAFFRHSYEKLPWSNFLDGVVVFGTEYPPGDTRNK